MNAPYVYYIRFTALVSDLLTTNVSFILSFYLISTTTSLGWTQNFLQTLIALNASWFIAAYMLRLYGKKIIYLEELFRRTWRCFALHFTIFVSFLFFSSIHLSGAFCGSYLLINAILIFTSRFAITYLSDKLHKKYNLGKKIAIVGFNETAEKLAEYFYHKEKEYDFHGFFDDEFIKQGSRRKSALVGSIENCISYATENQLEEIYSTILPRQNNKIERLVEKAEQHCIRIKFVPDFTTGISNEYYINKVGQFPVISLRRDPLEQFRNRCKKRAFDIAVSAVIIITVLSWLTPLLAVIIKLSSKGPVFFIQKRSGKHNHAFNCFKFRTMRVNERADELQAKKDDDRITRIGAVLRKTSMDELPQFFNVFIGNMSIIGPRPHMLRHTEQYGSSIDKYMVRHFLKPGITGWAQVNGYRGETETDELMKKRVEHDIWYMENWSLMLDVRIFFMTVIQFFRHNSRAY